MTVPAGADAFRLLRRTATIWLVDTAAFVLLAALLPGVSLSSPFGALAVVFWIGVLNVTLRPLLLAASIRFPLPLCMVIAFLLNVLAIRQADQLVAGVHITDDLWGTVVALGLGALNAMFSGLLGLTEDDSFYRHVVARRLARHEPLPAGAGPGLLIVQIDGLSEAALRQALAGGRMPNLGRWLRSGSHHLAPWLCDIPSMTSSAQAGILHGRNAGIPAFRWYDRQERRLIISNHPRDARQLDAALTSADGLLAVDGSSLGNVFRAGAAHHALTMSGLLEGDTRFGVRGRDLYPFLLNPYTYGRGAARMLWEVLLEYLQHGRQRLRGRGKRSYRGGGFPLLRVIVNVLMRDITVWLAIDDIYSGRRVSYIDLLGYDEVAHHAGPLTGDALAVLRGIDKAFHLFEVAARHAPRSLQMVVLSDHGQSAGTPFSERYGETVEAVVARLLGGVVAATGGHDEGWERVNATLSAAARAGGIVGRGTRRVLSDRMAAGLVRLGPPAAEVAAADVIICTSGNLAHLYFTGQAKQLTLEEVEAVAPGLVAGLRAHPGIGLVVATSWQQGALALGADGEHRLATGEVVGRDPLAGLPPATARCLERLAAYAGSGDLIINSTVDAATGEVAPFEDLAGSHGGAGGDQTNAFIVYPAAWQLPADGLIGAEAVHRFLKAHLPAGA